jgi:hypothetical protein
MTSARIQIALASALFLTGCATYQESIRLDSLEKAESALAASPTCCRTLADIRYERLGLDESRKIVLNASAPAFNFESGKSRFVAFQLPEGKRFKVAVTTHLYGGFYINTSYVFYPVAVVLDGSHKVIGRVENFTPQFRLGFIDAAGWSGSFPLDTRRTMARYLILFTNGGSSSRELNLTSTTTNVVTYGRTIYAYAGNKQYAVPFGAEGQLTIEFEEAD